MKFNYQKYSGSFPRLGSLDIPGEKENDPSRFTYFFFFPEDSPICISSASSPKALPNLPMKTFVSIIILLYLCSSASENLAGFVFVLYKCGFVVLLSLKSNLLIIRDFDLLEWHVSRVSEIHLLLLWLIRRKILNAVLMESLLKTY